MKTKHTIGVASMIAAIALLSASDVSAQGQAGNRGSGGWGSEAPYNKMYNLNTVETLSGEVLSVDRITPEKGMSYGIHIMVKTDQEPISVHLGPGWYIESQDIQIKVHDFIEVKGSRITWQGKPAITAGEVTRGEDVLKLRDEKGVPYWAGWRRR